MAIGCNRKGVGLNVKILELITFIKTRVPGVYYPNRFPNNVTDEVAMAKLTGGFPTSEWTGKKQPSFQVMVRGKVNGEGTCEAKAYEIHEALTNMREVTIGTDSVVVIRSMNSVPLFIGYDENDRPIYSINFDCVVRP
jgi:hypothetical protein